MRILITGAGSDIGLALAKSLHDRGDELICTASSHASLENMRMRLHDKGIEHHPLVFNLEAPKEAESALSQILETPIDGLVLNAWTRQPANKRLHDYPFDYLSTYLNTNVMGNIWLLQQCLRKMHKHKFGRIVFVSSMSTTVGTGRYGHYITAKSALEGLIKNIAVDYGEYNIFANTLKLGIFKTSRTEKQWCREKYNTAMSSVIPCNKLGETQDLHHVLAPLLSENQYINGSTIDISGGLPAFRFSGVLS